MAETSTIFGFMKYVSATDILSDFKKTVDSHFVNSLKYHLQQVILFYYPSWIYIVILINREFFISNHFEYPLHTHPSLQILLESNKPL